MRLALLVLLAVSFAACAESPTETVDDPDPTAAMTVQDSIAVATDTMSVEPMRDAMPEAEAIASGSFSGAGIHEVSGEARLLRLADGSHLVRLEGFETDNGPALEVWLVRQTTGDVGEGGASLGALKSTNGNQNYPLPADLDPAEFAGVSVWCERFSVNFGTAPLE